MDRKPVVALDIDGTLGDYHGHFIRFAEQWTGRKMRDPKQMTPDLPFFRFLGMSKMTYRQCKLAYRQGGMNRSMPVYEGASELTHAIRKAGAELWLCTTRPYMRHDSTDPDTRHWLRRNKIQWDHMVYGPNKYRDLVKIVPAGNVVAVLDDLPEMLEQAQSLHLPAYVRDQPYNRNVDFPRVYGFGCSLWEPTILGEIKEMRNGERLGNRRH